MALEVESPNSAILTTVDGRPLKAALAEAERTRRIKAVFLVMPLFVFILITFLYPIGLMLFRSVENPLVAANMPETLAELENWDGKELPPEAAFAAAASLSWAKLDGPALNQLRLGVPPHKPPLARGAVASGTTSVQSLAVW